MDKTSRHIYSSANELLINMAREHLKTFMCQESIFSREPIFSDIEKERICKVIDKADAKTITKILAVEYSNEQD